jgi:hypothetical protein
MAPNSDKDVRVSLNQEDSSEGDMPIEANVPGLKLDRQGLPLVPQPSDHKDDPLVRLAGRAISSIPSNWRCRTGLDGTNITSCSCYVCLPFVFNVRAATATRSLKLLTLV